MARTTVRAAARAAAKRAERVRTEETGEAPAAKPAPASAPEPETTREPSGLRRRLTTRPRLPLIGLAVLVILSLTAAAVLGWKYWEAEQTDQARSQALTTARKAAPEIFSYDHRHLDKDFAAARKHLTGSFLDEYKKTTKTVVAPTAKKYEGVVKASVATPPSGKEPSASVVSAAPDKVVVLLFMNQVTNSTQVKGDRLDLNRVRMTLTRTDAGWKISAVDAL
ncbi:hypothetical protein [Streptomyces gobiensis]|uniref:hypothetical protein n=1 Tax=Streptomyces gobiensis TaxID=2875706 RepID=UPI001E5810D3|nr:hypothetical protein [Streptomyces gobiensis]UGY92261.1 hypothetical protein test1122_11320 [Streptomyces gobiensis]